MHVNNSVTQRHELNQRSKIPAAEPSSLSLSPSIGVAYCTINLFDTDRVKFLRFILALGSSCAS